MRFWSLKAAPEMLGLEPKGMCSALCSSIVSVSETDSRVRLVGRLSFRNAGWDESKRGH